MPVLHVSYISDDGYLITMAVDAKHFNLIQRDGWMSTGKTPGWVVNTETGKMIAQIPGTLVLRRM